MNSNILKEENLTKNLAFHEEINNKKQTILFSSEKIEQNHEKENITNIIDNNLSFIEDVNKSTKTNSIIETKKEKVKFIFKYKPDMKYVNRKIEVLLVGTFLKSWDNYVIMEKNEESKLYEYVTYLQKKLYFFKFIVNNKWLCSNLYQTKLDESNNLNNWIDLTNYKEEEETETSFNDIKNIFDSQETNALKVLNSKPPRLLYYKKPFNLDNSSNQYKFVNKKKKRNNFYNNRNINSCYKKIFKLNIENIGHLITKMPDFSDNKNYRRISTTERNENKFITLVYYKPK